MITTSRDRVIRTLNHLPVDRAPLDLWVEPAVERLRADEVAEMLFRYPADVVRPHVRPHKKEPARGIPLEPGNHTDAWGCVWHESECGPQLVVSPLTDLGRLRHYKLPEQIPEKTSLSAVHRAASAPRFLLASSEVCPFQRLQWLHGTENTLHGLSAGNQPLRNLLDMLHDLSCREMETWAASDADGVLIEDQCASSRGLLVSPQTWRELFKPLYREYCEILHAHDKFVFFHSAGNLSEVLPDLLQCGIDALHTDLFALDLTPVADRFRNRMTFWGSADLDRALATGRADRVYTHVNRLRTALDYGRGGLIARCHWPPQLGFDELVRCLNAWLAPIRP